jgi:hypothetical protein
LPLEKHFRTQSHYGTFRKKLLVMNTQNVYLNTNAGSIGLVLALKLEGLGFKATLTLQKKCKQYWKHIKYTLRVLLLPWLER